VIAKWKRRLIENGAALFVEGNSLSGKSEEEITGSLCAEIRRMKMYVNLKRIGVLWYDLDQER